MTDTCSNTQIGTIWGIIDTEYLQTTMVIAPNYSDKIIIKTIKKQWII
jgi:hypothetical protein